MALPLPDLDTRRYADLLAEALAGIPAVAPAWTDFNPSHPGITLLELLAYVAEQDVYRVNRVPPGYRERFLALAGAAPRNPAAATLVLQPQEPAPLATGTRLRSDAGLDAVTLTAL